MKYIYSLCLLCCWFAGLQPTFAQSTETLRSALQQIVADKNATVGVAIRSSNGSDTVSLNGTQHFAMQSVFKFHIALAVLSQIDQGKFSLSQAIEVKPQELLPGLWSPLREANPQGGIFPISVLLSYAVSVSDNVACDVLLRLLGGPTVVETYFKQNNIQDISIQINEEIMQANWDLMFQNWTTPQAANEVLVKFYENSPALLSAESYAFVWKVMKETSTGLKRLKGQLPEGTVVAHKTGTSGSKAGITEAVNDIGVIFLPNGDYFFISVFVTHSKEDEATNEKIVADIAKAAWDYFIAKAK
ncbi:MAG TPA: class A beta-lactamase, subclass A2 [Microscillaceae bacterium]|nr:class A beta-lactamase, subclass A2 [Microscillaceae bacterium]